MTTDPSRPWRISALMTLMRATSRMPHARVEGLRLRVERGTCNPGPAPFCSFGPLFRAGVRDLSPGHSVLDIGTGTGVWGLLASRQGAQVTATDLPHVRLASVRENAERNGLTSPELISGDLFQPLVGRRFDRVLFNPPFHLANPRTASERAYLGGADGALMGRFLSGLPAHLNPGGSACIVLPRAERQQLAGTLSDFQVAVRAKTWLPLLGRSYCLELKVRP